MCHRLPDWVVLQKEGGMTMDDDLGKIIKCVAMAMSAPVLMLWLFLVSTDGFIQGSVKMLISLGVTAIVVSWVTWVVFYIDEDE